MRLVLAALSRPLTVVVALVAVALCAALALTRMPVDIFPQVGDPAIYVAQPYGGMDPAQMEGYLTYYYEYHFLYITGIDHVESKSIQGAALMKLVFHEGTDMASAMGETIGYVNRARAFMPPGTVPPFVTRFDAGSVAVGQLIFSSATHTQGELQDFAINRVRPLFATLPGVSAPPPFGGNQRTIVITLNPDKLHEYRVSPEEAIAAVSKATLVMPSGNMWTGKLERIARTNAALGGNLAELLSTPIRPVSGTSVYLRDIATIENGTDLVSAYAHVNGKRTVYIPVTKRADASTLAVISAVKAAIPSFKAAVPDDVDVRLEFDQSPFVTNSIRGLVLEGLLGAALTGLMVLLFLRDWRSALIVVLNIPFALLAAVVFLWLTKQSINIMTLGGLALAVGVLVDEATVEIENIHTQMRPGVSRARAVIEACRRTALARLLSMCCVLAVFVPSLFLTGAGRQLFVPLSLAVAFSLVASYLLSSTLVPVFSVWLMKDRHQAENARMRTFYEGYLKRVLRIRWPLALLYLAASMILVAVLLPRMGTEIFPDARAPLLRIRMRAPTGTRIEETERLVLRALDVIKSEIGAQNVEITSDFLGLIPSSYPVDLIHLFTSGPQEAIIQVALKTDPAAGDGLRERLREKLHSELPQCTISFEAADIVSQVMSFGSPTPIEVAVQGISLADDYKYAAKVQAQLARLSFLRDLQVAQAGDFPTLDINIDRERAGQFGLTMEDVARSVVPATSSSRFIQPNYWRDPNSGNAFQIQVELPPNRMQSLASMGNVPVMGNSSGDTRLIDLATLKTGTMPGLIERYNGQHVVSLTANLHGTTLGEAAVQINRTLAMVEAPPKGVKVVLRGEIPPLEQTLSGLRTGLLLAVLVIFLLLAASFQSVRLALAVVLTIPAVLCGVLLMLILTGTTLNVQSFMGAIMAIGIAVANSILLITFAERARHDGSHTIDAAVQGAASRLRAILMTAAAMIFGMVPMAIGFGEGGAQSAPLGRAVIGGLILSTFTTLTILPAIYAILQNNADVTSPSLTPTIFRADIMKRFSCLLMMSFLCQAQHVELVPVVSKVISRTIDLPGEFQTYQSVEIHAKVRGYVDQMLVDRGSLVKQGQLLATLSAPEMKAQLAEAASKVSEAEANRLQAEAQLAAAQSTYDRLKKAAETPGVISGNELIQAEQQVKSAEAMVQSRRQAKAAMDEAAHAQTDLEAYLRVKAPFSGIVTDRLVHPGALVGPGPDPVLLILQDIARLRLIVAVPEQDSGSITKGAPVEFHVPAFPKRVYKGTVARISHALDQKSRTMAVELDIFNRDGSLSPGMYPSVKWPVAGLEASLLVPKTSVVTTTERTFVIREANGKAQWVNVTKGISDGDFVEISGGIQTGERVVKRATDEIREGSLLQDK